MADLSGLDPNFANALGALIKASNGAITLNSGYRSPQLQAKLWQQALAKYGDPAVARLWVAPPGHSFHEQGLAADLGGNLALAHQLAPQYGLTFPLGNEAWHIEPVGNRTGSGPGAVAQTRAVPTNNAPVLAPHVAAVQMPDTSGIMGNYQDLIKKGFESLNDRTPSPNTLTTPSPELANALGVAPTPGVPNDATVAATDPNAWLNASQPLPDLSQPLQGPDMSQVSAPTDTYPSPLQMMATYGQQAANRPNAYNAQALNANANAADLKFQQDYLNAHPLTPDTYAPYTPPSLPQRQYEAIPNRPAPGFDPLSSALAAIGGFVDPVHAGMFNADPLAAASSVANQQYQDQLRRFEMATQQDNTRYGDALYGRNDQTRYDLMNRAAQSEADAINRQMQAQRMMQEMGIGGKLAGSSVLTDPTTGLPELGAQETAAQQAAATANLIPLWQRAEDAATTANTASDQADWRNILGALQGVGQLDNNMLSRQLLQQGNEIRQRGQDLTYDLGQYRQDAKGNLVGPDGKPMTTLQMFATRARYAQLGINLPPGTFGPNDMTAPDMTGAIGSAAQNKALSLAYRNPAVRFADQDFQRAVGHRNALVLALQKLPAPIEAGQKAALEVQIAAADQDVVNAKQARDTALANFTATPQQPDTSGQGGLQSGGMQGAGQSSLPLLADPNAQINNTGSLGLPGQYSPPPTVPQTPATPGVSVPPATGGPKKKVAPKRDVSKLSNAELFKMLGGQ
jgi:hypothetical protein